MIEVSFDMYSHDNEHRAHMAFRSAMKTLDYHNIPYSQTVEDIYFSEPPGKKQRTFYVSYRIIFHKDEDYTAFMLVRD